MFFYEKWEVFRALVELQDVARKLAKKYKRQGLADVLNQLVRAASSAVLNCGEGAKSPNKGHKLESYGITLGSIGECNASFIILAKELRNEPLIPRGRNLCDRTSGMMTNLIKSVQKNWDINPPPPQPPPQPPPPPPPLPPPT